MNRRREGFRCKGKMLFSQQPKQTLLSSDTLRRSNSNAKSGLNRSPKSNEVTMLVNETAIRQ